MSRQWVGSEQINSTDMDENSMAPGGLQYDMAGPVTKESTSNVGILAGWMDNPQY
jgi:hypothetical protein